mgnify:CR=1 FL=1
MLIIINSTRLIFRAAGEASASYPPPIKPIVSFEALLQENNESNPIIDKYIYMFFIYIYQSLYKMNDIFRIKKNYLLFLLNNIQKSKYRFLSVPYKLYRTE